MIRNRKLYDKAYYERNKETIKITRKNLVKCECGCVIKYHSLSSHKKSGKHFLNMMDKKYTK